MGDIPTCAADFSTPPATVSGGDFSPPPESELEQRPPKLTRRQELLRLALRGCSAKRAAEVTGIPYSACLEAYKDKSFRAICYGRLESAFEEVDTEWADAKASLQEKIASKGMAAFNTLCKLLENEEVHPGVRAKIAQDILDRNPDTQAGHTVRHEKFDPQQLMRAAAAASEMDNVIEMKRKKV